MKFSDLHWNKDEVKTIKLLVSKKGLKRLIKMIDKNFERDFMQLLIECDVQHTIGETKYNELECYIDEQK